MHVITYHMEATTGMTTRFTVIKQLVIHRLLFLAFLSILTGVYRRKGTPSFMAVEVQLGMFSPPVRVLPGPDAMPDVAMADDADEQSDLSDVTTVDFTHNYIHDIEGLWWIAVQSMCYSFPTSEVDDERTPNALLKQRNFANAIFPNTISASGERTTFLTNPAVRDIKVALLHVRYQKAMKHISLAGVKLQECYAKVEYPLTRTLDPRNYFEFYASIAPFFEAAQKCAIKVLEDVTPLYLLEYKIPKPPPPPQAMPQNQIRGLGRAMDPANEDMTSDSEDEEDEEDEDEEDDERDEDEETSDDS